MNTGGMHTTMFFAILSYLSEAQPSAQCTSLNAPRARAGTLLQTQGHRSANISHVDLIYKIFYINLDRSIERRSSIEEGVSEISSVIGVTHERFPAVYGKNDSWCIQTAEGREQVLGTLGCFRSHVSVWEKALAEEPVQPWIMVMEDDAVVPDAWQFTYLRERLEYVPSDADIVRLSQRTKVGKKQEIVAQGLVRNNVSLVVRGSAFSGFSAYLVKVSSIEGMVRTMYGQLNMTAADTDPCRMHVDCAAAHQPSIHSYTLLPGLISLGDEAKVSDRGQNETSWLH